MGLFDSAKSSSVTTNFTGLQGLGGGQYATDMAKFLVPTIMSAAPQAQNLFLNPSVLLEPNGLYGTNRLDPNGLYTQQNAFIPYLTNQAISGMMQAGSPRGYLSPDQMSAINAGVSQALAPQLMQFGGQNLNNLRQAGANQFANLLNTGSNMLGNESHVEQRGKGAGIGQGIAQSAAGAAAAAGMASMMSDERLKRDIRPVAWQWQHGDDTEYLGVIAQDIQRSHPHLVARHPQEGYLMVDYGAMVAMLLSERDWLYQQLEQRADTDPTQAPVANTGSTDSWAATTVASGPSAAA